MRGYNRPLTDEERARIPEHAAVLLAFLEQNARPGNTGRTVVNTRRGAARKAGLTKREFGLAEAYLNERHVIRTRNFLPRNEVEAAEPIYRWILPFAERNAS